MAPIDYFMGLFVGVCVGLAGLAYINTAASGVPGCHNDDLVVCPWALERLMVPCSPASGQCGRL